MAMMLAVLAACGAPVADTSSGSPSPAPSATPAQASSLWRATVLAYPSDILAPATKDVGERSLPYRDVVVSTGGLQLMDASARYAVLTDNDSSQLRLVDLRTGTCRLILPAPLTLHHEPTSKWVKAKAAMRKGFGAANTPTQILDAQVSGPRLVWQEALCLTTGGMDVTASAIFAAHIGPRMSLGDPKLIALGQPQFVPDPSEPMGGRYRSTDWPSYIFDGQRILLIRSGLRGEAVQMVNLRTNKRTPLIRSPRHWWGTEAALLGKRAVLCFEYQGDRGRLLFFNLRQGSLPVNVALVPQTELFFTDVRDFALGKDGSVAWAKWYSPDEFSADDYEAVFLVSPGEPIRCMTADGGEPVFFGKTILWIGLNGNRLGGANTDTLETFTVAGGDHIKSWSVVAGSGHTAVILVRGGGRGSSTLRVFDVE